MMIIMPDYRIKENTLAILPAKQIEYQAIVVEMEHTTKVALTPFEIIKAACLANWMPYEGALQAVTHHTSYKQKVPIPLNPHKKLYAFPTHSPRHMDCHCFLLNHIVQKIANGRKTILVFTNGDQYEIDVSNHTMQKQINRTKECKQV